MVYYDAVCVDLLLVVMHPRFEGGVPPRPLPSGNREPSDLNVLEGSKVLALPLLVLAVGPQATALTGSRHPSR